MSHNETGIVNRLAGCRYRGKGDPPQDCDYPTCGCDLWNAPATASEAHSRGIPVLGAAGAFGGDQFGYHGMVPLSEASPSTQSEALKTTPSTSAPCDDHAITVPPSVENKGRTLADYRPQHDDDCESRWCYEHSHYGVGDDLTFLFCGLGDHNFAGSKPCSCGLDATLIAAVRSAQPPSQDDEPEIIERKGPNPLQSLYDDPKWVANYFAGLEGELARLPRRTLARMIVDKLKAQPPSQARQETEHEHDLGAVSATEVDAGPCLVPKGQLPHDGSGRELSEAERDFLRRVLSEPWRRWLAIALPLMDAPPPYLDAMRVLPNAPEAK